MIQADDPKLRRRWMEQEVIILRLLEEIETLENEIKKLRLRKRVKEIHTI